MFSLLFTDLSFLTTKTPIIVTTQQPTQEVQPPKPIAKSYVREEE